MSVWTRDFCAIFPSSFKSPPANFCVARLSYARSVDDTHFLLIIMIRQARRWLTRSEVKAREPFDKSVANGRCPLPPSTVSTRLPAPSSPPPSHRALPQCYNYRSGRVLRFSWVPSSAEERALSRYQTATAPSSDIVKKKNHLEENLGKMIFSLVLTSLLLSHKMAMAAVAIGLALVSPGIRNIDS